VKPGVPAKPIIEIVRSKLESGWKPEHFLLGSFSQAILLELHRALPEIETVVIESWSGVRASRRARQLGTKRISMNQRWLWSGFIKAVRRNNYQLSAYTLNDPAKAKRWAKVGLYGVVTDFPDRFEK
jgi:glycerophosphoryl diester phosphodiesterase